MGTAPEQVKKRSFAKILRMAAAVLLTAAVGLLTAALAGVQLFGLIPYAVPMDGAWGEYRMGDLLYLSRRTLQTGDAVIYVEEATVSLSLGTVVRKDRGLVLLETGDGTTVAVEEGYIAGTAVCALPYLGHAVFFLRSAGGRRAVCLLVLGMLLWLQLPEKGRRTHLIFGMFKNYSQTRRPF